MLSIIVFVDECLTNNNNNNNNSKLSFNTVVQYYATLIALCGKLVHTIICMIEYQYYIHCISTVFGHLF